MAYEWLQKICVIDVNGRQKRVSKDREARLAPNSHSLLCPGVQGAGHRGLWES